MALNASPTGFKREPLHLLGQDRLLRRYLVRIAHALSLHCIHVVLQPFRARPLALPRSSLVTQERGVQQLLLLHPVCQKPRNLSGDPMPRHRGGARCTSFQLRNIRRKG